MNDSKTDLKNNHRLTTDKLIEAALENTLHAINGYDAILWKIRTGYLAILYGGLILILGKEGTQDLSTIASNLKFSFSIFFLILGFSFAGFMVDFGYLRKKVKVIIGRDVLVKIVLNLSSETDQYLWILLQITGEADIRLFPDEAKIAYKEKKNWNLRWILLPLYATTPTVAMIMYMFYHIL